MNNGATTATSWPRCRLLLSVPAFAILLLFVTFWQLPGHTLLWRELQNTGHTLLFGVLALLALCSYVTAVPAGRNRPARGYLAAAAISLLSGGAVEIVQLVSGGDADAVDVLRDLAGILIALAICAGFDPHLAQPGQALHSSALRTGLLALAAGLCITSAYPLASLAWAYHQREQTFPVIVDLSARWAQPFIQLSHARSDPVVDPSVCAAADAGQRTRLHLEPVVYAGYSVTEPHPDWRGYDYLVLDIFSMQSATFEMTLRIHDAGHNQEHADRFNRVLTLSPGANRIHVRLTEVENAPAGRHMDMAHIAGVMLFIAHARDPLAFCTDPLHLE